VPPRTGNDSHGRVPLNVYRNNDGYVAMNIAVEEHWHNLLRAMGREDLRDDPRFADNTARVANREATDALAPVREVDEVMRDRHMHERGMLEWIEHDEIGRVVVPTTPLRIHGADPSIPCPARSSASTTVRFTATGSDCRPPRSPRSNKTASSEPIRDNSFFDSLVTYKLSVCKV